MKFGTHPFEKFDSTLNKIHYVKSVQMRSIFWSVFSCIPIFLIYGVNLRIQSEYRKIRARKYSVFGHFSRSECFHFKGVRKRLKKNKFSNDYQILCNKCDGFQSRRATQSSAPAFFKMVPRFQLPFAQHFKNNPKFTPHCFESLTFSKLNIILATAETYTEPSQTSKMELFAKIVNSCKPLTIFAKCFILDTRQCSEYAPALDLTRLDNVRDLFSYL